MLLKNKVCLVVGAGSPRGMGRATVELFAEHGARLAAVDLTMNDGQAHALQSSLCARLARPVDLIGVDCDIVSADACDRMVDAVMARFGRIDCLVNCAGVVQSQGLLAIDDDAYDLVVDVNMKGAFHLSRSVLRVFSEQKSGVLVHVASLAGQRGGGLVGGAHYAAAKGGVISLTRSIAREFGARGIRANVVCPAMIETAMLDGLSSDKRDDIVRTIPLGRTGQAREAAGACLFLASDLSSFITGATLDVNGGCHIH